MFYDERMNAEKKKSSVSSYESFVDWNTNILKWKSAIKTQYQNWFRFSDILVSQYTQSKCEINLHYFMLLLYLRYVIMLVLFYTAIEMYTLIE